MGTVFTILVIILILGFIVTSSTQKRSNYPHKKSSNQIKGQKKQTTIQNYKNSISNIKTTKMDDSYQKMLQDNMNVNLKIVDAIRIKFRSLIKIVETTYELKVCPKCHENKMNLSNSSPTGDFITCECFHCFKVQRFKLLSGKDGSDVVIRLNEIKQLWKTFKSPVDEDFYKIDIDNTFVINTVSDYGSSKNDVRENSNPINKDDSIIDITDVKDEYIVYINETPQRVILHNFEGKVPSWENHYIFSHTEINDANYFQKQFYKQFKTRFLNEDYTDLQENINYSFILYFDLFDDYTKHRDIDKLEKQLLILSECYPKTKRYALKSLSDEFVLRGEFKKAARLNNRLKDYYGIWRLGDRLVDKFNLDTGDIKILNTVYNPRNEFCNIEFCLIECAKLYILIFKELERTLIQESTNLEKQIGEIAESSYHRFDSQNKIDEMYGIIFEHCENMIREYYGHKSKIDVYRYFEYTNEKMFESRILSKVKRILPNLISTLRLPDTSTEIILNKIYTTRWRTKFDEIKSNFKDNGKKFYENVLLLGELNLKNPSIENIFYESSRFVAGKDRIVSLKLYAYYIFYDLKSVTFNNKQIIKTTQKILFDSNEQILEFQSIINELIRTNDLEKALNNIPNVYIPKRKQILLDNSVITEVEKQHKETVGLLNEVFKDETDRSHLTTESKGNDEINLFLNEIKKLPSSTGYKVEFNLTEIQVEALNLFAKNSFNLSNYDLEVFAKLKSTFKNTLIESINEIFYEFLNDVLIEEEGENYIINENYYHKILDK